MEKKQKKEWKKPELVDFDNRNTNNAPPGNNVNADGYFNYTIS
jgi:hypothetical protein